MKQFNMELYSYGLKKYDFYCLTQLSLMSHKTDINKERRPRSDAADQGLHCIKHMNFQNNKVKINIDRHPFYCKYVYPNKLRWMSPRSYIVQNTLECCKAPFCQEGVSFCALNITKLRVIVVISLCPIQIGSY